MVWRIRVDWLPEGDETKAEELAHGRICHLRHDERTADLHAYFEADEVPMASNEPPYKLDDPRKTYHCVSTAVVEGYPRFQGSVWDLIATMLTESGRGRPAQPTRGLMLSDIPEVTWPT